MHPCKIIYLPRLVSQAMSRLKRIAGANCGPDFQPGQTGRLPPISLWLQLSVDVRSAGIR